MRTIMGIDPGTTHSGIVTLYEDNAGKISVSDIQKDIKNEKLVQELIYSLTYNYFAIEYITSRYMIVGQTTFDTCVWIGRFIQAIRMSANGLKNTIIVPRLDEKLCLCGNSRAKDPNIKQSCIDMFPAHGGGRVPQIGIKSNKGSLYGLSSHAWSALAVALTAREWLDKRYTSESIKIL